MTEVLPFSAEDFRRRVAERLACARGDAVGDHVMNPHLAEMLLSMERTQAAVLVPVIHREPEATMLLTLRTGGLRSHAGQIAFPGGRIDPDDSGPVDAALREAEEEIGLTRNFVEALCLAPDYLTGSGYHVAPVLAIVQPNFQLRLNTAEVADTFEVPLSFIMNPSNYRPARRFWKGAERNFFEVPWQDRNIWGITAGILRVLYERLYRDDLEGGPR